MIIEWILEVSAAFNEWFATLFPPVDLPFNPAQPVDLDPMIGWVVGIGFWVDFGLLAGIAAAAAGIWVAFLGTKAVRALVAHVPFFGGRG